MSRIVPDDGDPRHGTTNGYRNLGCRCDACRAANAARQLAYMRAHPEQRAKQRDYEKRRRRAAGMRPLARVDAARVRTLRAAGMRNSEIAAEMGISHESVLRVVGRQQTSAGVRRIEPLAAAGKTASQIARALGVHVSTVTRAAERAGITLVQGRPGPPSNAVRALRTYRVLRRHVDAATARLLLADMQKAGAA